jgi:uncharacterized membrane protein YfcA
MDAYRSFAAYRAGMILLAGYIVLLTKVAPMPGAVWTVLAVFAAALVSSVVGFGFAALSGAMLVHLLGDPMRALEITLVCGIASQAMMVWSLRRDIDWHVCPNFLLGVAAGLPVGFYVLLHACSKPAAQALGALLVVFAVGTLLLRPIVVDGERGIGDAVAGFLGGLTGGIAAFPAAPIVVWCSLKGWSKERQRGLYQPVMLILQLAGLAVLAAGEFAGSRHRDIDWSGLLYLPAALLGTSLGLAVFSHLNDKQFALSGKVLLIVCGASLLL